MNNKMTTSFPLPNIRGSCWINATLHSLFRCPTLQERYTNERADVTNPTDVCLQTLWKSKGEDGLKDLFDCIRTDNMPAGRGIGDSHELLQFFCDKLPWLDEICRYKVGDILICDHCKDRSVKYDSLNEVNVTPSINMSIHEAILESCKPIDIPERKCEKCNESGCKKQLLFSTFPKLLLFHRSTLDTSIEYSSVLILNGKKYALFSVICYNGSHWWTYGRDLPIGSPWYRLDDDTLTEVTNKQFPLAGAMRMLLYFLVDR